MRAGSSLALLVLLVPVAAGLAADDPVPVGTEFRVESYVDGYAAGPRVAMEPTGDFVVVWTSYYTPGGDYVGVQGRRFAADGTPAGDQFQVNQQTAGEQWTPDVAALRGGGFVVVWGDHEYCLTSGFCDAIRGRLFAPQGVPASDEFAVSQPSVVPRQRYLPRVAGTADGGFLVVWGGLLPEGPPSDVHGRRFSAEGLALGDEFEVSSHPVGAQTRPDVGAGPQGFVVVWQGTEQDGDEHGVFGQRFASDGARLGGEFAVNTYTSNSQREPAIVVDESGSFLVAWQSTGSDGSDPDVSIQAQRFAADGGRLGRQFQVNSYTPGSQDHPELARLSSGEIVGVWTSWGSPGSDDDHRSILGGVLAQDGSASGEEFQVNSYTTGDQRNAAIAASADGRFVVVWTNEAIEIRGQRFAAAEIFADGFESGDTSAWAGGVP